MLTSFLRSVNQPFHFSGMPACRFDYFRSARQPGAIAITSHKLTCRYRSAIGECIGDCTSIEPNEGSRVPDGLERQYKEWG